MSAAFCGVCGAAATAPHPACLARLELEPPRYCAECARRMVVQVTPIGWTARCSRHGTVSSDGTGSSDGTVTPAGPASPAVTGSATGPVTGTEPDPGPAAAVPGRGAVAPG
ncbi:MAG TPA: hypothetical protein VGD67_07545 [Pseudonocardiaceae bacterium]